MPAMDTNYDNIIKQMEEEVDQLQAHFKSEESKILNNIVRLTGSTGSTVCPAAIAHAEGAGSRGISRFGKVKPITETPEDVLVDQIDSQLGGFYGSMELRDSLKEAQSRMQAVLSVLHRVREFVRSPFVRLEIEHLQHNIFTLQKVFMRMFDRMEIPDSDDFFNEAMSTPSQSDVTKKAVNQSEKIATATTPTEKIPTPPSRA